MDLDYTSSTYFIAANTMNPGTGFPPFPVNTASGMLVQVNSTGAILNSQTINILDPSGNPFDHTYILDMRIGNINDIQDPLSKLYIVGYIADGMNSVTSLKKPFIACYNLATLTLIWSNVIDRADRDNIFSSVELCPNYGIIASGCTRESVALGVTSRMVTSVLFSPTGTELNNFSYYSNGPNVTTDADYSRVADLMYQNVPSQNIAPSVVILTYNDVDQNISLARLDLATFTLTTNVSSYMQWVGNNPRSVGFSLNEMDWDGLISVTGYDYSAPLMSAGSPNARFPFASYHDPLTLGSSAYGVFDINNTGYEFLSNDAYYQPLGNSYTAPDGFFPEMSYSITDATYNPAAPNSLFMSSNRLRLTPIMPGNFNVGRQSTTINNYNYSNPNTHCAATFVNNFNYTTTVFPLTNSSPITSSTADFTFNNTNPSFKPRSFNPDPNCPSIINYKRSSNQSISVIKFSLSPNPTTEFLNINLGDDSDCTFIICNIEGKEFNCKIISKNENEFKIDVSNLNDGIYFLTCKDNQNNMSSISKFIKQ